MVDKQEIKLLFLEKCASEGLSADEIEAAALALINLLEKQAGDDSISGVASLNPLNWPKMLLDTGGKAIDVASKGINSGLTYGVALPAAGAVSGGMLIGHTLGKATAPQQEPEEIKDQELADTYRQYAAHLRQQAARYKEQQAMKVRAPSFR